MGLPNGRVIWRAWCIHGPGRNPPLFYIVICEFCFLAGDIDMHENQGRLLKIMIIVVKDT